MSSSLKLHGLAFAAGFFSLLVQVVATHLAFSGRIESSYAIGLSLFCYLAGLGVASGLTVHFQKSLLANFERAMALVWTAVGLYFFAIAAFPGWSKPLQHLSRILTSDRTAQYLADVTLRSIVCLFLPALMLGLIFPILNDRRTQLSGARTGLTSSLDYFGAALGSLFAALYLVPHLGIQLSAQLVSVSVLAFGLAWLPVRLVGVIATIAATIFYIGFRPEKTAEVVFHSPSPFGDVVVTQAKDDKVLTINGRRMCSSQHARSENSLAKLPLRLIQRRNLRALNVGLGCGFTANEFKMSPAIEHLDVAEINPVIVQASAQFHKDLLSNEGARTEIAVQDGLDFLRRSHNQYDIIAVDVEEPSIIHSSALFTQDFFKVAAKKLTGEGYFTLWSFAQPETAKIILNTLKSVFAYADVFVVQKHLVFLASNNRFSSEDVHTGNSQRARQTKEAILAMPQSEIATVARNPYPKYFKVNEVFGFTDGRQDQFEIKSP